MKKFIVSFLIAFCLINIGLAVKITISNEPVLELATADNTGETPTGHLWIPDSSKYSSMPVPHPGESGQDTIKNALLQAVQYGKVLASVIAVLFVIFMGVRYVTSGGDEEAIKKSSKGLLLSLLALALISMSQELAEIVGFYNLNAGFDSMPEGGIVDPDNIIDRVTLFDRRVEIIMVFIKYFVAGLAVLMLVINGVKLVTGGGEEENVKKARNGVAYSIAGLLLLYLGNTFVENVFYRVDKDVLPTTGVEPQINLGRGVQEIIGVTNFIVSFVGPLLMLLLVIGGVMYLVSGGEEEKMNKAKRLIIAAVIGVIVIYGAFAIVSTITTGYFAEPSTLQEYDYLDPQSFLYPFKLLS